MNALSAVCTHQKNMYDFYELATIIKFLIIIPGFVLGEKMKIIELLSHRFPIFIASYASESL